MKEILFTTWLTLLGLGHTYDFNCPCSVDSRGSLQCDPGTIQNFPADILETCSINPKEVIAIELWDQPLSQLQSRAFLQFSNLLDVMMPFNKISFIAQDAFYGLTKLHNLFLADNNITQFAKGTFDDLVSLKALDVRGNDYLNPTYVTSSWHMCHREETTLRVQGNLLFFYKDLEMSQSTNLYCDHLTAMQDYSGTCTIASNSTLDCTELDRIEDSICFLKKWTDSTANSFENILFDFPVDPEPTEVENFFEGEENPFFQDFNSFQKPSESKLAMYQIVKHLTFYSTIFDLSNLTKVTSRKTKKVTIWADTIFISAPITISYQTVIRARKVSIDQKITMNITKDQLLDSSQDVEIWAMKEEYITIKNITMRQRKFGLLEILDEVSNTQFISTEKCNPLPKDAIKDELDISGWFDFTQLNLMYVCAHTIQDSGKNLRLVNQIVNFTLDYTFNSTLVNNQKIYSTARKFKKLIYENVHNVPSYSIDKVQDLAEVMHDRMQDYRVTELEQEEQLQRTRARVEDMQTQFDIVEEQQEVYFNLEMTQLELIWEANNNTWYFNFEHRNDIEESIGTAMEAMMNQTFEMREKELIQMLKEAENSVDHIQDIIDKYQSQIVRYKELAKASFKVQQDEFKKLRESKTNFNREYALFKIAVQNWQFQQTVKTAFSYFTAIFQVFLGEPPDLENIFDAEMMLLELAEVWSMMDDIEEMIDDMNLDDIFNISMDPSTEFMIALNRAVDMKMKGPAFDNIAATASIKLDDMNEATDHEIDHTADVMMALQSIADLGNRMIGEIGEFADNMLSLAERYDEIAVAQKDLDRAVDEVNDIKEMIEGFEDEKNQFYSERAKAKQEYEDEINKMREDYENISAEMREEYRKKITELFDSFKLTFSAITDSYNNRMSSLIESIQRKSYGLKEYSMNQRTMIMVLYKDFCDTLFFHSFGKCIDTGMPLISDSFDRLLDKLSSIRWDSITADDAFPPNQRPQSFPFLQLDVKDDLEGLYYPIQILKNESKFEMNITRFDTLNGFADFWRIRIKKIKITLYDENNQTIESPGDTFQSGGEIKVRITHPSIFIDQTGDKEGISFLGQGFFCDANYWTHPDLEHEACEVDSEFSSSQYESTPNGLFKVEIKNPEEIKMQDIHSIRVEFSGTHIPYIKKHNVFE